MTKIDVNKLDCELKVRISKKVVEKYGLSYVARKLGVDRSTLCRHISGEAKKVPDNVIAAAAETLDLEELSDSPYGFKAVDADPITICGSRP